MSGTPPGGTTGLPPRRRGLGLALLLLALLALAAPFFAGENAAGRVGVLLLIAGAVEAYDGFRRAADADQRAAWQSGVVTLLMGGLVLNAGTLLASALVLMLAGWFLFDAGRHLVRGGGGREPGGAIAWALPALGNLAAALLVLGLRERALVWTAAIAAGLRIAGTAWNVLQAPVRTAADSGDTALADLGLSDRPEMVAVAERVLEEERARGPVDRGWIRGFVATFPVGGMSWYFDTENWTAGVWNSWAEARTDVWREAMVGAVSAPPWTGRSAFAVTPEGVPADGDFAFLVIGDPGEGDASQHVLRDSLLDAARQEEVRFVVLSSDVVYPTGAMKDYEAKFWLPFKGVRKPVYAIPGNHDWYDALEGFAATFLDPASARAAMRARVAADGHITSTTDARMEDLIRTAQRLGREYGVPVGGQRGPYFELQTDRFALLAIDTGVVKRVDDGQRRWLEEALAAARGKFTMAVLGHPFYAGGVYQAADRPDFAAIHALLREHGVAIAMAGDTHDLEHYVERYESPGGPRPMRHWVNGGGGAYLSFGTALAWPARPATPTWAFYPGHRAVFDKIESSTPPWKWPAWWWTKKLGAWPSSPEWLSAAFDSNEAPFFQSFVEVRVEPSANRVRLLPWGVHGRLRWSDLDASPDTRPAGAAPDAAIEWIVPWPETGTAARVDSANQ